MIKVPLICGRCTQSMTFNRLHVTVQFNMKIQETPKGIESTILHLFCQAKDRLSELHNILKELFHKSTETSIYLQIKHLKFSYWQKIESIILSDLVTRYLFACSYYQLFLTDGELSPNKELSYSAESRVNNMYGTSMNASIYLSVKNK